MTRYVAHFEGKDGPVTLPIEILEGMATVRCEDGSVITCARVRCLGRDMWVSTGRIAVAPIEVPS